MWIFHRMISIRYDATFGIRFVRVGISGTHLGSGNIVLGLRNALLGMNVLGEGNVCLGIRKRFFGLKMQISGLLIVFIFSDQLHRDGIDSERRVASFAKNISRTNDFGRQSTNVLLGLQSDIALPPSTSIVRWLGSQFRPKSIDR